MMLKWLCTFKSFNAYFEMYLDYLFDCSVLVCSLTKYKLSSLSSIKCYYSILRIRLQVEKLLLQSKLAASVHFEFVV